MASEQIHCSQNFFPFVFMLMFSPLLCLCPYSLYLTLCILLYPCKYSASSFPLVPSCIFLLPAPPSPRPIPYMYLLPYPLFSLPLHVCIATSSLLTSKECGSLSTLDCHLCFCLFTLHTEYPVCVVLQCSAEFTWP